MSSPHRFVPDSPSISELLPSAKTEGVTRETLRLTEWREEHRKKPVYSNRKTYYATKVARRCRHELARHLREHPLSPPDLSGGFLLQTFYLRLRCKDLWTILRNRHRYLIMRRPGFIDGCNRPTILGRLYIMSSPGYHRFKCKTHSYL